MDRNIYTNYINHRILQTGDDGTVQKTNSTWRNLDISVSCQWRLNIHENANVRSHQNIFNFRFPKRDSIVPVSILWPLVTLVPISIFFLNFILTRNFKDLKNALLGHSLSFGLNGVLIGREFSFDDVFIRHYPFILKYFEFTFYRCNEIVRGTSEAGFFRTLLSRWRHELGNVVHWRQTWSAGWQEKFSIRSQLIRFCHVGISELLLNCKTANLLRRRKGKKL